MNDTMSDQQVRLATLLLQESFGEVVEKVASFLMRHGSSTLAEIVQSTELKPVQVTCTTPLMPLAEL